MKYTAAGYLTKSLGARNARGSDTTGTSTVSSHEPKENNVSQPLCEADNCKREGMVGVNSRWFCDKHVEDGTAFAGA